MSRMTALLDLFGSLASPFTGEDLFDRLDDVVYFVKNERAEYVVANRTLAERCGARDKRAILGKTAEEVFPGPLGRSYREQDEALLRTGAAVVDQLELHLYPGRDRGWCLTNKLPLRGRDGRVIGLVGASRDLHPPSERAEGHEEIARAIRHARDHPDRRLTLGTLAATAGLSSYQFDRRVRKLFRLTTGQLLLKIRMDAASEQLGGGDRPIAEIALACGYADQSAFARQFRKTTGLTPLEFRADRRASSPIGCEKTPSFHSW